MNTLLFWLFVVWLELLILDLIKWKRQGNKLRDFFKVERD